MHKTLPSLLATSLLLGGALSANAANVTWNPPVGGSGGSISWNNATNWGGSVPANNITDDLAVFNSTVDYNFQPSLDAFTVQSVNGLRLGGASTVAWTLSGATGQQTTNGSTLVGSSTITLADVTGLAVGQQVTGSRIQLGTFITAIVGNTITISRPTSGGTLNTATALTFASSLRLGDGGINLAADTPNVANIITAPIVLGADQQWSNDSIRSLQIQGSIYLDNHTLTLTGTTGSTISFNGASGTQSIGGSGNIIVDTLGTVSFGPGTGGRQQSSFTGGVTLNNGAIALQGGNAGGAGGTMGGLGTGVFTINGGSVSGGGNIGGRALTISGQVWNADWSFTGGKDVDMGMGGITLGTAVGTSRTLTTSAVGYTLTIGGGIANGTTASTFIKEGSSALLLTGTSTYTGETLVNAGTLILNGALDGGGDVTIAAGATLAGSGSIAGNTFISGAHRPGNSPGVQTFEADLTYNSGASFQFELTANSSTQGSPTRIFDQVIVGGDLDFAGSTSFTMVFNVAGGAVDWSDAFWTSDQSWLVYDVAGLTTNFSNLSVVAANWADAQGDLFNTALAGASFSLRQAGNDVYLDYVAIPEPSTALLLGGGLIAVTLLRRRRHE